MPLTAIAFDASEPQTLDEIRDWQQGVIEALADQRVAVRNFIQTGLVAGIRLALMPEDEVEDYYDAQRRELDRLTVFNLVASAEASIKIDYHRRVDKKLKDHLAQKYRQWNGTLSSKKRRRPDFHGILNVLKAANVMDNHLIGQYRECLRARHWLGHGRHWAKPMEVDRLGPEDVYDRAAAMLRAMPV